MAREKKTSSAGNGRGRIARVRGAVARTARKLTSKLHGGNRAEEGGELGAQPARRAQPQPSRQRPKHLQPDVEIDLISTAYSPMQTSLKAPFRANGDDHQRDQDMAAGYSDERWSDEDRFTNKSGDPRIGTHGRTYEPGERRGRGNE